MLKKSSLVRLHQLCICILLFFIIVQISKIDDEVHHNEDFNYLYPIIYEKDIVDWQFELPSGGGDQPSLHYRCRKLVQTTTSCPKAWICLDSWLLPPARSCLVMGTDGNLTSRAANMFACKEMRWLTMKTAFNEFRPSVDRSQKWSHQDIHWLNVLIDSEAQAEMIPQSFFNMVDFNKVWQISILFPVLPTVNMSMSPTANEAIKTNQEYYKAVTSEVLKWNFSPVVRTPHIGSRATTRYEQLIFVNTKRRELTPVLTSKWRNITGITYIYL